MNNQCKINTNMPYFQARLIFLREAEKCVTKKERKKLWAEYEPVLKKILEKEMGHFEGKADWLLK